jgi:DegV family protein with EDD domain
VSRVRIVTDGDIQLDASLVDRLAITIVPLTIRVRDEVYQTQGVQGNEELLARMDEERVRPLVIGPTVPEFTEVYTQLSQATDQIISVHSSSALSGVVANAELAAAEFLGRRDIVVVDSQTTSLGLSILVKEAAEMARAGADREDVLREIRGMVPRVYVVMFTDTLDYLEKSGLISQAQCILGTMLGIKPFLAIEEGEIIPMEKVRSREKGLDKVVEFAAEFSRIEQIAILQSGSQPTDETIILCERLQAFFPGIPLTSLVYGPLLASHVGPDGLGLVAYEGERERETF